MNQFKKATFAGGCFWCMVGPFKDIDGVIKVVSGYIGGKSKNPTYEEVSTGRTGHLEAVQVLFDPVKISYLELLEVYWRQIDPTDIGGQFVDRGSHYTTAIFYHDEEQKKQALESKDKLKKSGVFDKPIVTKILPAQEFYEAEEYHQDFYLKNEPHYKNYSKHSGRQEFIEKSWGQNDNSYFNKATRLQQISPLQYKVTQEEGTEPPFNNEFWDNKKEGLYVDVVSGEPLFSSHDKYDSGSGWPSFFKPITNDNINYKEDRRLLKKRVEVRSKIADSHLGHVFEDGPEPTGLRYCINSAALRFIPREKLKEEGYENYEYLFE